MLASGFANTVGTAVQSGEGMLGQLPLLAARPEACWASAREDQGEVRGPGWTPAHPGGVTSPLLRAQ